MYLNELILLKLVFQITTYCRQAVILLCIDYLQEYLTEKIIWFVSITVCLET